VNFEQVRIYKNGRGEKPLVVMENGGSGRWALHARKRAIVPQSDFIPESMRDEFEGENRRSLMISTVGNEENYPTINHIKMAISSFEIHGRLSVDPRWHLTSPGERHESARSPANFVQADKLDRRGSNLQTVLLNLKSMDLRLWEELKRDFRRAFPWVLDLDFIMVGGPMVLAVKLADEPNLRAASEAMSDGMFLFLLYLTSFATNTDGVIGFDEPENGLHPELVQLLVNRAERHGDSGGLAVLVTHSDMILDALSQPAESVRILARSQTQSQMNMLNIESINAWLKDFTMSDLRAKGMLGVGKR
jgi:predicted ATPase